MLGLWEGRATWSVGHAFGLGNVVARIAHNFGLQDITTLRNLPFSRHPNSIAVLFTHINEQSTRHTLWIPLVPFLFRSVLVTFCAKNTQVTNSCIETSSQFLRHLAFHWCRCSTIEYLYHSITGLSPQFFRQSTGVKQGECFAQLYDFLVLQHRFGSL